MSNQERKINPPRQHTRRSSLKARLLGNLKGSLASPSASGSRRPPHPMQKQNKCYEPVTAPEPSAPPWNISSPIIADSPGLGGVFVANGTLGQRKTAERRIVRFEDRENGNARRPSTTTDRRDLRARVEDNALRGNRPRQPKQVPVSQSEKGRNRELHAAPSLMGRKEDHNYQNQGPFVSNPKTRGLNMAQANPMEANRGRGRDTYNNEGGTTIDIRSPTRSAAHQSTNSLWSSAGTIRIGMWQSTVEPGSFEDNSNLYQGLNAEMSRSFSPPPPPPLKVQSAQFPPDRLPSGPSATFTLPSTVYDRRAVSGTARDRDNAPPMRGVPSDGRVPSAPPVESRQFRPPPVAARHSPLRRSHNGTQSLADTQTDSSQSLRRERSSFSRAKAAFKSKIIQQDTGSAGGELVVPSMHKWARHLSRSSTYPAEEGGRTEHDPMPELPSRESLYRRPFPRKVDPKGGMQCPLCENSLQTEEEHARGLCDTCAADMPQMIDFESTEMSASNGSIGDTDNRSNRKTGTLSVANFLKKPSHSSLAQRRLMNQSGESSKRSLQKGPTSNPQPDNSLSLREAHRQGESEHAQGNLFDDSAAVSESRWSNDPSVRANPSVTNANNTRGINLERDKELKHQKEVERHVNAIFGGLFDDIGDIISLYDKDGEAVGLKDDDDDNNNNNNNEEERATIDQEHATVNTPEEQSWLDEEDDEESRPSSAEVQPLRYSGLTPASASLHRNPFKEFGSKGKEPEVAFPHQIPFKEVRWTGKENDPRINSVRSSLRQPKSERGSHRVSRERRIQEYEDGMRRGRALIDAKGSRLVFLETEQEMMRRWGWI